MALTTMAKKMTDSDPVLMSVSVSPMEADRIVFGLLLLVSISPTREEQIDV
jgi:hypothetical protein